MLSFRELHREIGISQRMLRKMIAAGLPHETRGRARMFDREQVDQWLLEHGYAEADQPLPADTGGQVARTYQQLAEALGMKGKDPIRQLSRWVLEPGFPGKPGTPGRGDSYFPVDQIKLWLAARNGETYHTELNELRIERERLRLEREIREEMLAAERLADVDEVARHNSRCVANAKAVLEPLADAVIGVLPGKAPAAKQWPRVLSQIHAIVQQLLDDAYAEIEGMIAGDVDETDDDE
jgi:hypothetical protein